MAPADRGLTASKSTAARAVCGVRCLRKVGSGNAVNRTNPCENGPVPDRPRRRSVPLARVGNRRTYPTCPGRVATSNALVCPAGSWQSQPMPCRRCNPTVSQLRGDSLVPNPRAANDHAHSLTPLARVHRIKMHRNPCAYNGPTVRRGLARGAAQSRRSG